MLYREVISEARRLPLRDQLRLVEELLRDMRLAPRRIRAWLSAASDFTPPFPLSPGCE
jgi:hypothetical protein